MNQRPDEQPELGPEKAPGTAPEDSREGSDSPFDTEPPSIEPPAAGALAEASPEDSREGSDSSFEPEPPSVERPAAGAVAGTEQAEVQVGRAGAEDVRPSPTEPETVVHPARPPRPRRTGPSIRKLAVGLAVVAVVAVAGLWGLIRLIGGSDQSDILVLVPESREELSTFFEVDGERDLAQLVLEHAAWRVAVPDIEGAAPVGVGFAEIRTGISIPVLVYRDADGSSLLVSVINYAFLDTHEGLLRLDRSLLDALAGEETFVLPPSSNRLLWRSGDDVFLVPAHQNREALADRILP